MNRTAPWMAALAVLALVACGDDSTNAPDNGLPDVLADTAADPGAEIPEADVSDPDVPGEEDVTQDVEPGDVSADAEPGDTAGDVESDVPLPPVPELPTQVPLTAPADPLADTELESCAVYQEHRCADDGTERVCAVYDTTTQAFVDDPDPLLHRALLFDRWRDLYNSPVGQAIDRDFNNPTPPGTPEEVWADIANLKGYLGAGDGGIWSGWSTVAAVLRYAQTGTEADYQRMEQYVHDLLSMYEVTGIPGYLSRYHFLLMPAGAPVHPEIVIRHEGSINLNNHHFRDVAESALQYLPDEYSNGYTDDEGTVWEGRPMWQGRPSIDQSTGPMTSLPMAFALLRDQELKDRIAHHLTCYAKRLQRIELINLQSNPDLLAALMSYFAAGELLLDDDDMDLTQLDRVVGYVNRQVNPANEATFDKSCPDTMQVEPWRVIDATSDTFLLDLLGLVQDMDTEDGREEQIDHFYWPSLRGADAMHLMHLMTMNYYMTGDEQYREFLYRELVDGIAADQVMLTAGAFSLPKFCKKYYGDQITYGPWWAFLHLLGDSPLRDQVRKGFHTEMWDKFIRGHANVDFGIMYAGALPPEVGVERDAVLADALELLPRMGGNGWVDDQVVRDDPRRSYTLAPEFVLANAPEGTEAVCPTQAEFDVCTAEVNFMGVKLPGLGVGSRACTGSPWECELPDGKCTSKMTNLPLPPDLRPYTDFLWQRNPFAIGATPSFEGNRQYAGSDYSEPYWNARRYGFITEGAGQVLAWRDVGTCSRPR